MSNFENTFGKRKIGFLIKKFEERNDRLQLINIIKTTFRKEGYKLVGADEANLHNETWRNIKEFMDNCQFGIAIIDNFSPSDDNQFNPNMFLEIGYMLAQGKNVFILIQNSLEKKLPTDVKPFLYSTFDYQDINSPILVSKIVQWIDKTINYNPGYLSVYLKKEYLGVDFMSELKKIMFAISDCETISETTHTPDKNDILENKINYSGGIAKVKFKTRKKNMLNRFKNDFEIGKYNNIPHLIDAVLKIEIELFPGKIKPDDNKPGISHLLNSETEELVYCTRQSINGCDDEIERGKEFLSKKETLNVEEIEIVILKKKGDVSGYLYITNFKHQVNLFPLKMYHGRVKDCLPCLPLNLADILFMTIYGAIPHPSELKNNTNFREQYLKAVDLHIDKVKYTIQENGIPIDFGLAKNVREIKID